MLRGWQIKKKIQENTQKKLPYKQMKDRKMNEVIVYFKQSGLIQGKKYYYYQAIKQPENKITMAYIANLGKGHVHQTWTSHGGGGYVSNITFDEEQFKRMKQEVERLGGKVEVSGRD